MSLSVSTRTGVAVVVALALLASMSGPASASTTSTTYAASADTYVNQGSPKTKYGTAPELRVGASPKQVAYLRFGVVNVQVTRATLRLNASTASSGGIEVHTVADTGWNEKSMTWASAPPLGASIARSAVAVGWVSIDVTGAVTSGQPVSFGLTTASDTVTFRSRETGANGPQLVVETSQAPAPDTTPPAAPSALTATGGDSSVALDWADNAEPDLAGYRVYRRNADGTWPAVPLLSPTASAATDTTAVNGTSYAYRVTAVDSAGNESGPSTVASATPTAAEPPPGLLCSPRSAYTDAVMSAPGPVGYWRLGEASGTTACDSIGTSNGTYRYGYRLAQPGLLVGDGNTSVALDGTSGSLNIPSVTRLNPGGAFSLEAWVNPATVTTSQTVMRKEGQFLLRLTSGSAVFRVWWNDGTYSELSSPNVLEAGVAQHLVASYDKTAMRLYRNGTAIASRAATKTPATGNNAILVGQSGGYDYFSGRLDELAQYDVALSAAAVSDHYIAGRGGVDGTPPAAPTGLVANVGNGSVALDWNDNSEPDISSYRVYRASADGTWPSSPIQTVTASGATDTSVVNGTTYSYRVTAVDLSGNESTPSPSVTVTAVGAAPPAPRTVTAIGGATAIGIRWASGTTAASYAIYRRNSDGTWPASRLATVSGSVFSYVDHGPPPTSTYRVTAIDGAGTESAPSTEATATLAPNVLVAAGDIAGCDTSGDEATAAILDGQPGTVLTLGDNVYESGTVQEFAQCYDPTWGRQLWRTQPAVGDHEYRTPGASGYFSYFGAAAGDPSKGYYSFDRGGWHIVVLNANCAAVGGCGAGSPQEQWLRQDLAANPAACTAAVIHRARFSSGAVHGSQPAMEAFWKALYDAGAEVVLSGHEHVYERFAPQTPTGAADPAKGIRQFTVGTGGRVHYSFGDPLPNSEVRHSGTFGVLRLTLHPGGYDWTFLPEAGKTFTDTGSGTCH
jgi:acid phosphatase type 7